MLKPVDSPYVIDVRLVRPVRVGAAEIGGARRHVLVAVELAVVQPELAVEEAEDEAEIFVIVIHQPGGDILPRVVVPRRDVYIAVVDAQGRIGRSEALGREVCGAVVLLEVVLDDEGELVLDYGEACPCAVGIVVVVLVGITS